MKKLDFEVVEVWHNNTYRGEPFTLVPKSNDSQRVYAIKIGNDFFHLGRQGLGMYISDFSENSEINKGTKNETK